MSTRIGRRQRRSAGRSRPSPLLVAALLGLLSMSAACGARWTDEQHAEVASRAADGESSRVATGTGSGSGGGGQATGAAGGAAGGAASGSGTGGAAAGGGTGGQGGSGPSGPQPCAAPSEEQGVTDDQITVGAISSLSGPVPGLGASAADAVQAYVAHRNATGGVCGRELVLRSADDGTDLAQYRAALTKLDPEVVGITGGFAVGDLGSEQLIEDLGIPIINSPTGRTGELPLVFDINPDFPRPDMLIGKYRYLYEQGARKVSMTYIAVDQSRIEAGIQRRLMEAAGLQVVHTNELSLSTLSYDSAARAAANSGANYLWFIADTNGQAAMARSVQETGHDWLFKEFSYTSYGTSFLELAGDAAEGVTSWLRSLPTEEADTNEAMSTFVEWMERTSPGRMIDLFAIDSYVSVKAFVEAMEALPGPISREAIVQQLASIQSYDADGMYAPITLGQDLSQGCFMAMIVRNGAWERLVPAGGGYLC
jgi:ABC-type branched-subunit amino acid transport system substrate-binding protein